MTTTEPVANDYSQLPDHPLHAVPEPVLTAARTAMLAAVATGDVDQANAEPLADAVLLAIAPTVDLTGSNVDAARRVLANAGYVAIKDSSYRKSQERVRAAEQRAEYAKEEAASQRDWVERELLPRERHLSDRLTFVYGVARAHGATVQELQGDLITSTDPTLREHVRATLRMAATDGSWSVGDLAYRIQLLIDKSVDSASLPPGSDDI